MGASETALGYNLFAYCENNPEIKLKPQLHIVENLQKTKMVHILIIKQNGKSVRLKMVISTELNIGI